MDDSNSRVMCKNLSECLDLFESIDPDIQRIITCLQRTNQLTDNVIKCLDKCSESTRKEILFCLLLNELEDIQNRTLSCETDSVQVCGQGIDGVTRNIRTDVNNVLATLPSASTQSQIGRLFSVSDFFTLNSALTTATFIISNPAGSGRIMYLDSVFGGNRIDPENQSLNYQSAITILISRDATPGTAVEAERNLNFGLPDNSAMSASFSNGFSGTRVASTIQVVGHFSLDFAGKIIIPPGHSVGIGVFAFGLAGTNIIMNGELTAIWYELDQPA